MSRENFYLSTLLASFILTGTILFELASKFTEPTVRHLIQICRQTILSLTNSTAHLIGFVLMVVLAASIVSFFLKSMLSVVKNQRKLKILLKNARKHHSKKLFYIIKKHNLNPNNFAVIEESRINALVYGFIKPKLLLSKKFINSLSKKELEAVILHELAHIKRHHLIKFLLSDTISTTLFFLPVLQDLSKSLRLAAEQEADNYAITLQGSAYYLKSALAKTVIEKQNLYPGLASNLETRINNLLGKKPAIYFNASKRKTALSLLTVFLIITLYLIPATPHNSEPDVQLTTHCLQTQCSAYCFPS